MVMVVSILENFLGHSVTHYESKSQVQFDCPMCAQDKGLSDGDGKGNLAVNYSKGVFKCWACWERNNMYGNVIYLIKRFGNQKILKDYLLVAPVTTYTKKDIDDVPDIVELPKGFKPFSKATSYDTQFNEAYKYVKSRGLGKDILDKYNIGFTADDKYKGRIIIPSYDIAGELNYFIARAFEKWVKPKYLNPDAAKELAIFNEHKINWDGTIYLVEGAFDHIVVPNSIPLLGKFVSDKLFHALQMRAKGNIVIALDGGEEERADSLLLYRKLNTLNLYNKIKVVTLKDGYDLSLIHEKYKKQGIIKTIRTATRLSESRL